MMPLPGTMCAWVMCDQSAILCTPLPYWPTTVLPMSANLRSSKIMNLCLAAKLEELEPKVSLKSGYRSQCVLEDADLRSELVRELDDSRAVSTSAATQRFVFLVSIRFQRSFAHCWR